MAHEPKYLSASGNLVAKHAYKFNKAGEIKSIKEYKRPKYPIDLQPQEEEEDGKTNRRDQPGEAPAAGDTDADSSRAAPAPTGAEWTHTHAPAAPAHFTRPW